MVLYAVTFACRALYHFEFFGPIPTFLLMVLITATAFLLAVRLNALVVAVLGMLGGFLTPILLSTGQDNPLGLFGYIAILDVGLDSGRAQPPLEFPRRARGAGHGADANRLGGKIFRRPKNILKATKSSIALAVLLGFNALYLAANWLAKRRGQIEWLARGRQPRPGRRGAGVHACSSSTFAPLAQRPLLMFSFVFLIDP